MSPAFGRSGAWRFLRYLMVGTLATAAHYALLIVAVESWRWPAWLASGAGAVLGAQLAYAGNRWFTFTHRGALAHSWPRFQATALLGALLGMGIVALAVRVGLHYVLGQMAATVTVLLVTYTINRHWTFAAMPDRG